ncbi:MULTISPECIES: hypothetical protein [unclassified Pantoea]|uniref:hypothetical protein n=1 Tax=unclassified Pantoea TaxID=2630326 RepID=UPI001232C780|nr:MULTISPECIES: hypothetical protein [unclassified Pantoea]KAA5975061.1 hypothetical protein F3I51_04020 [Pantoea sp. M_6]KAA5979418.1 hypothetical protein F3I52_05570 [Pantoea sp. M_8]KAA5991803.1 hypothetical protein F3I47_08045 [Pantoea sp. M_10]KAA5998750.1 hypothetical protein F3I50_08910 [Pantoea sp. M_5]
MINAEDAKDAARDYAFRHKLGWSEKFTFIKTSSFDGVECYIVETSSEDAENKSWMEIETSTPVNIYVDVNTGKCFGHQFGNRGFNKGI